MDTPGSQANGPFSAQQLLPLAAELGGFAVVFVLAAIASRAAYLQGEVQAVPQGTMLGVFLLAFAAATASVIILIRRHRGQKFFAVILAAAVLSGIASLVYVLAGGPMALGLTVAAYFVWTSVRRVWSFDLLLLVGIAGLAANIAGQFSATSVVIVLAVLAAYDVIAVYGTKHMVQMGEAMLRHRVFFAMIVPDRAAGFATPLEEVGKRPGHSFLGTGDLTLPAMLVASAAHASWSSAAYVGLGAIIGLATVNFIFISQRVRRPMPALPPIALGAIIGHLAAQLIL